MTRICRTRCAGRGGRLSPFAGIPFAVKDLFDVAGEVTTAGSALLAEEATATADSDAVAVAHDAGGRFCRAGPHQHDRVRLFRRRPQSPLRHATVRLRTARRGAFPAALHRARPLRWPMACAPVAMGYRYGWLMPHSGGLQRHRRLQAIGPAGEQARAYSRCRRVSTSIGPLANSVACCATADSLLAGDWAGNAARPSRGR